MPFLQTLINLWIRTTGKRISLEEFPWLDGPMGEGKVIGADYYKRYAAARGLVEDDTEPSGLVDDFAHALPDGHPDRDRLLPEVAAFYEQTSRYKFDVWSQWYSPLRYGARWLIRSVSKGMDQFNVPLQPLETSYGMASEVIKLRNAEGEPLACWLRKTLKSGRVVYAGFYSICEIPQLGQRCVRVVFPLPMGNVTVIFIVEVQPDGSVILKSKGKKIGDAGYYRIRKSSKGQVKVKYVPLKEVIHVFVDPDQVLRTDHEFFFWGIKFLHLHYRMSGPA